jgi:hypothetical protein
MAIGQSLWVGRSICSIEKGHQSFVLLLHQVDLRPPTKGCTMPGNFLESTVDYVHFSIIFFSRNFSKKIFSREILDYNLVLESLEFALDLGCLPPASEVVEGHTIPFYNWQTMSFFKW